jgi:hypothetical protein
MELFSHSQLDDFFDRSRDRKKNACPKPLVKKPCVLFCTTLINCSIYRTHRCPSAYLSSTTAWRILIKSDRKFKSLEAIPSLYTISIHPSMALQSFVGTWPPFQFLDLFTQSIGLLGWGSARRQPLDAHDQRFLLYLAQSSRHRQHRKHGL